MHEYWNSELCTWVVIEHNHVTKIAFTLHRAFHFYILKWSTKHLTLLVFIITAATNNDYESTKFKSFISFDFLQSDKNIISGMHASVY